MNVGNVKWFFESDVALEALFESYVLRLFLVMWMD